MSESDESREPDASEPMHPDEEESQPTGTGTGQSGEGKAETEQTREELRARIDELETERDDLETRLEEVRGERDELTSKLKRRAADFENYKKRQQRQREQIEAAATERVVTRLLDVRDNLKRAIDEEEGDLESLREGVKLTLTEFDRVLDAEDVSEIDPSPGTEVDPERHEVMLQVDSEQPDGHIAEVYQPGYEMGEKVLRAAQVTVSHGSASSGPESEE